LGHPALQQQQVGLRLRSWRLLWLEQTEWIYGPSWTDPLGWFPHGTNTTETGTDGAAQWNGPDQVVDCSLQPGLVNGVVAVGQQALGNNGFPGCALDLLHQGVASGPFTWLRGVVGGKGRCRRTGHSFFKGYAGNLPASASQLFADASKPGLGWSELRCS
jgi:hypothetical protein